MCRKLSFDGIHQRAMDGNLIHCLMLDIVVPGLEPGEIAYVDKILHEYDFYRILKGLDRKASEGWLRIDLLFRHGLLSILAIIFILAGGGWAVFDLFWSHLYQDDLFLSMSGLVIFLGVAGALFIMLFHENFRHGGNPFNGLLRIIPGDPDDFVHRLTGLLDHESINYKKARIEHSTYHSEKPVLFFVQNKATKVRILTWVSNENVIVHIGTKDVQNDLVLRRIMDGIEKIEGKRY